MMLLPMPLHPSLQPIPTHVCVWFATLPISAWSATGTAVSNSPPHHLSNSSLRMIICCRDAWTARSKPFPSPPTSPWFFPGPASWIPRGAFSSPGNLLPETGSLPARPWPDNPSGPGTCSANPPMSSFAGLFWPVPVPFTKTSRIPLTGTFGSGWPALDAWPISPTRSRRSGSPEPPSRGRSIGPVSAPMTMPSWLA